MPKHSLFFPCTELVVQEVKDLKKVEDVAQAMQSAIAAKQYGYEALFSKIIAQSCINVCPRNPKNFNVDNVRVVKVSGATLGDSYLVKGFAIEGDTQGTVKHVKNAKVAVFGVSVDTTSTETKGTVLIKNSQDLLEYNMSEEKAIEREIKEVVGAGCNVIVTTGSFSEMAKHFIEKYNLMAIKCSSKFQSRRLCKSIGASPLVRLGAPTRDEIGECDTIDVVEIGDRKVIVFKQIDHQSQVASIIVRGATKNVQDEAERAVDDGVNVFKVLTRDNRLLAGAGAAELEMHHKLTSYAEENTGLEQYAIRKFAESFLVVPRILAESAGHVATDVLATLTAAHQEGKKNWGVDIENADGFDAVKASLFDCYLTKATAIKLATEVAISVLSVDQIIMARPAGGPKPRDMKQDQEDD